MSTKGDKSHVCWAWPLMPRGCWHSPCERLKTADPGGKRRRTRLTHEHVWLIADPPKDANEGVSTSFMTGFNPLALPGICVPKWGLWDQNRGGSAVQCSGVSRMKRFCVRVLPPSPRSSVVSGIVSRNLLTSLSLSFVACEWGLHQ